MAALRAPASSTEAFCACPQDGPGFPRQGRQRGRCGRGRAQRPFSLGSPGAACPQAAQWTEDRRLRGPRPGLGWTLTSLASRARWKPCSALLTSAASFLPSCGSSLSSEDVFSLIVAVSGREEREGGEKCPCERRDNWSPPACAPETGLATRGDALDQESDPRASGAQTDTLTTEPHRPGLVPASFLWSHGARVVVNPPPRILSH